MKKYSAVNTAPVDIDWYKSNVIFASFAYIIGINHNWHLSLEIECLTLKPRNGLLNRILDSMFPGSFYFTTTKETAM